MNAADIIAELNHKLDELEENPLLKEEERHDEYYAHSSVHGGNLLKEHALMVCAAIDEDDPQYHTLVQPLILRIEKFFAHPGVELDFTDEIRLIRARRLIEQGKYHQADLVYSHIPYSPIYAKAFEQRNHYFANAAKNHLHLLKKLTHPAHIKHQLLSALQALQYIREYPNQDEISLYQNAEAIFAHNYYNEAKMLVTKICIDLLPDSLKTMNQREVIIAYKTLSAYKHVLAQWRHVVKTLQKQFVSLSFTQQQFQRPEELVLDESHALLDEPTSTITQLQHLIGKTSLEKDYLAALVGSNIAVQHLRKFVQ